jgi:hypothetical protein
MYPASNCSYPGVVPTEGADPNSRGIAYKQTRGVRVLRLPQLSIIRLTCYTANVARQSLVLRTTFGDFALNKWIRSRPCIGRCLFEGRGCLILSYDKVSAPVSTRVLSRTLLTLPKKLSKGSSHAPFGSSADGIKSDWIVPPDHTFCPCKLQLPVSIQT